MGTVLAWIMRNSVTAAFTALTVLTIAVLGVLLARGKLDGEGAAVLMVVVAICALLAVGGSDLIDRIVKFGPLELSGTASAQEELPEPLADPNVRSNPTWEIPTDVSDASPWIRTPMTPYERWQYEQATIRLVRLRQQGQLQKAGRLEQFRGLILDVGEAALNELEFAKGLDMLRLLESLGEKTVEELLSLGTAYLWAAPEDKQQRQKYLRKALLYLEETSRADRTSAITFWTLGYVYDELERYPAAISANEEAIRLDLKFLPWANWHIAISLLKLAKQQQEMGNAEEATAKTNEAMEKVEEIPPGLWWQDLREDEELEDLRDHSDYKDKFSRLAKRRIAASDTQA